MTDLRRINLLGAIDSPGAGGSSMLVSALTSVDEESAVFPPEGSRQTIAGTRQQDGKDW